jgi:hypothetical protein
MKIMVTGEGPFHVRVPERHRSHELVAGRVFYTLPARLLDEVVNRCGHAAFGHSALDLEVAVTDSLAHNTELVGFDAAGEAISYPYLCLGGFIRWTPSAEALKPLGLTPTRFAEIWSEAQRRMEPTQDALRGYLGWLTTNPQFVAERDDLFTSCAAEVEEHGVPRSGPTIAGDGRLARRVRRIRCGSTNRFLDRFAQFYARWRLQHLITRELPMPLAPQSPIITPLALLTQMRLGSVGYYQPDIVPIPSRDSLRNMLEDVRVHGQHEHLAEWHSICRSSRQNDHAMRRYGKIFVLQHYWSLLEQRYPQLLRRRVGRVQEAFAEFLYVSPDAVDKYRQRIRSRLTGR